jgi:hypothetical protein
MSTVSSPTVNVTLSGIGATDFTKSDIGKGYVRRTSDDGLHSLEHYHSTTSKGRRRAIVKMVVTDPADQTISSTCTLTMDFPKGNPANGIIPARAVVDFLQADTWQEIDLLAAGHNFG